MFHYWYNLEINFRCQPIVCDRCFNENHNHYYYMVFLKNIHINNIKMLYHEKFDVSDINKTSASKECMFCLSL